MDAFALNILTANIRDNPTAIQPGDLAVTLMSMSELEKLTLRDVLLSKARKLTETAHVAELFRMIDISLYGRWQLASKPR